MTTSKSSLIKTLYFYVVSLISLMMIVFSTADLVNIGLKTWVFTKADDANYYIQPCAVPVMPPGTDAPNVDYMKNCEDNNRIQKENYEVQKQRDAVRDLAFLVVGIPLFAYHWRTIRKESRDEK
ncbi:MAG: hypothetical protein WC787_03525 [Patescibacteria group bacterium]|jgi:hypothetical protein